LKEEASEWKKDLVRNPNLNMSDAVSISSIVNSMDTSPQTSVLLSKKGKPQITSTDEDGSRRNSITKTPSSLDKD